MLIVSNTSCGTASTRQETDDDHLNMKLGMETLNSLIDICSRLCCVGNLRTWANIDYYNPQSENYFQSGDSQLGELKRLAVKKNWNLDLESENLDYLYTSIM